MASRVQADFEKWETEFPGDIKGDVIWKSTAYRMALYADDWVAPEVRKLASDKHAARKIDQLARAVEGISATFAEGYSRLPGRDRLRYYEYSLGSARESRDFWIKLRRFLGVARFLAGLELFTRLVQLLTAVLRRERDQLGE